MAGFPFYQLLGIGALFVAAPLIGIGIGIGYLIWG